MNFNSLRSKVIRTVSPALCVALLVSAAGFQRAWPAGDVADAFHERARDAVEAIPTEIDGWTGESVDPAPAAIEASRPNVVRTIKYVATPPSGGPIDDDYVWLNVTACRRASDLLGHFPTKCYPAYGDSLLASRIRDWTIAPAVAGGRPAKIRGVEYVFERVVKGVAYRRTVYNFLIAPGRGVLSDMKELSEAAEDYRQRPFGAAQVQVVFATPAGHESAEARRDEVFSTLMRAAGPAIEVLKRGG